LQALIAPFSPLRRARETATDITFSSDDSCNGGKRDGADGGITCDRDY